MDGLVVIGAGLPRTGTLSTRAALELLLGGPCYHGSIPLVEQIEHQPVWREAFNKGNVGPVVEEGVLDGFRAGLDYPFMCWYRMFCQFECLLIRSISQVQGTSSVASNCQGLVNCEGTKAMVCQRPDTEWRLSHSDHLIPILMVSVPGRTGSRCGLSNKDYGGHLWTCWEV